MYSNHELQEQRMEMLYKRGLISTDEYMECMRELGSVHTRARAPHAQGDLVLDILGFFQGSYRPTGSFRFSDGELPSAIISLFKGIPTQNEITAEKLARNTVSPMYNYRNPHYIDRTENLEKRFDKLNKTTIQENFEELQNAFERLAKSLSKLGEVFKNFGKK